ncbi:PfkB family carbohydrate kinase [uncultured Ruthenibacterium sp.]|uniref:PfkB family carbohydrate kinase n=1 Tax=uncultured Ruthenibacterium sp. TaxID=1905347 RepID=UPI00349EE949
MTIRDIAKIAGVSPATVSCILNHKDQNISQETRTRVLEIIERTGYVPYAKVREKLAHSRDTVGLVLPNLDSAYHTAFVQEMQRLAMEQQYTVAVSFSENDEARERQALRQFQAAQLAGVVLFPCSESNLAAFEKTFENTCALVMENAGRSVNVPQVYIDFYDTAQKCTQLLLEEKHQRIGLLCTDAEGAIGAGKILAGYRDALQAQELAFVPDLVFKDPANLNGVFETLHALHADALICQTPSLAEKVFCHAAHSGIFIPDDLSVVCLQDFPGAQTLVPSLTAFRTDVRMLAQKVWEILCAHQAGQKMSGRTFPFSSSCVKRASTRNRGSQAHKVLVAGSINMDTTLSVSRFPRDGETLLASQLNIWPGGKGANQAICVSRFGAQAYILGALGSDANGKQLYAQLKDANVHTDGIAFIDQQPTGTAYINVLPNGKNTIVVHPGANGALEKAHVRDNLTLFQGVQYCLVQLEIPLAVVTEIAQICRRKNIPLILKPSPVRRLPESLLENLFLLIPNQEELHLMCPEETDCVRQAQFFLQKGVQNVIVTLGEQGCIWVNHQQHVHFPARNFPCVDSTGASDIFIGCLTAMLTDGKDMKTAIEIATVAASFSVSRKGVQNAILERKLLEDLYQENISITAHPGTEPLAYPES